MHDYLLSTEEWYAGATVELLERNAGIADAAGFNDCIESGIAEEVLARDEEDVERMRMAGTPTVLSRKRMHTGSLEREEISRLVASN